VMGDVARSVFISPYQHVHQAPRGFVRRKRGPQYMVLTTSSNSM